MVNRNMAIVGGLIKYIVKVKEYSKDVDHDSFVSNTQLHEACIFNLLQMGELVTRLDEEFISSYPEIPWIKIRGFKKLGCA